jgi:uncharacterized protein YndB with AHSA1/START domain
MPKAQTLTFRRTLNAPPTEVYRMLTHATALRDWLCNAAQAEARLGGGLYVRWESGAWAVGQFTALEPGKKVAFTWTHSAEPEPARITISLSPKNGGTALTLKHAVGPGKKWAAIASNIQAAWESALENLQSVLETGIDQRVARRPRLGIFIDDFTPEIAARIGVPVKQGIRLTGTAEGTGARAAGLQKDDVIVKLGGKKAVDFPTLTAALHGRHAGDVAPVVFYRGAEKMTAPLELSRFPTPKLPPTAAALAEAARKVYADLRAEFAKLLEGVAEAEADKRPAPNEWNTKELVAHFVACERDLQSWVADMLNDNTIGDSLEFRPNVTVRLRALVARYPTLPALLDELKYSSDETIALVAAFPPEFVARKHMFGRVAQWITEVVPGHLREEHNEQLKATLAAARRAS